MQTHTTHKEIYDPFAHYIRGILVWDDERFTFTAHRQPYIELNEKSWDSEKAFHADYQRLIARKYCY